MDVFGYSKITQWELKRALEEFKELLLPRKKEQIRPKTTLPVQLFMLHYLGFLKQYELSDIKKAKLFSILINADAQNIRKDLPNFIENQLRDLGNEKHLMDLSELFKDLKLNEISQTIEKDLIKLRTGK